MYQGMFAIITPALISGAMAERVRFGPYCLFILLWAVLVYDPLAHWVWAVARRPPGQSGDERGRRLARTPGRPRLRRRHGGPHRGRLRRAGGDPRAAQAHAAIPRHAIQPNSMVLTLTGAGLLWFGWFGFNGGSALAQRRPGRRGADRLASRGGRGGAELAGGGMAASRQADRPGSGVGPGGRAGGRDAGVRLRVAARRPVHRSDRRGRLLWLGLPQAVSSSTTIRSTPSASTASAASSAPC